MNINFNKIITNLLPFMILFTIAFIISKYLYIQLPKNSKEFIQSEVSPLSYFKYNVQKSFNIVEKKAPVVQEVVQVKKEYLLNENIKLQAVYHFGGDDGLAVISEKSNSKTHTLGKNDKFREYTLISIYPNYILFSKGDRNYKLEINVKKIDKNIVAQAPIQEKIIEEKPVIVQEGNNFELTRKDLNSYSKDLKKIWNNIGLKTYRKDGKAIGFIVYKLKEKSVFTDIGLKKGDVLIKANNIDLTSYQNAFKIYNQVDKMDAMKLVILRNNNQMELEYEIK